MTHSHYNEIQRSESFPVGALLALSGGLLDAYTYVVRGGVFANAQTGNMVLLGLRLSEGRWHEALRYLIPILAFAAGVLVADWMQRKWKHSRTIHWRQLVLGLECALLFTIGFIPSGVWDASVNILISFVCALQVESFRTMHGLTYATTMCTGNLRSGTELLFRYFEEKNPHLLKSGLKYYAIIAAFILGAAAGFYADHLLQERSVWIPCGILIIVFLLLRQRPAPTQNSTIKPESENPV